MKFINLDQQYRQLQTGIDSAILKVLNHGQYIFGPEVQQLEQTLASFVGVDHCIAMSSGTTALEIALQAIGVKSGDEVITTAFSFFSTAEVIARMGAIPVMVDVNPLTYNMDEHLIEAVITEKTKAIMPVSLYGQPANYTAINAIAEKYQLPVIEDGAQSFGSTHHGKRSCGLTTIGCTSFFPSKPLGCYGDGGACFTNDASLAETMRCLINHGQYERYVHEMMGCNGRLDTIQAAVLLEKVKIFEREVAQRQQVAAWYAQSLPDEMVKPHILSENVSVFGQYTIQVSDRDVFRRSLNDAGIPTAVHYPKGMHQQPAMTTYACSAQSFPHTEKAAQSVVSLPFYPSMSQSEVSQVVGAIKSNILQGV
ncbi:MAG: aminotransferase DegT [Coxiellaceae bacterium]|nr:aminotransferase DegT [Coxiellaceae bacterium]